MKFLDYLFHGKELKAIGNYFKMLNGYSPTFTSFSGGVYEMDLTRTAINNFATHCSKLKPEIEGSALKSLEKTLQHKPNYFMDTLLVLTERKTRNEIIFKLPDHTDEAVVAALDRLERKWGADMFKRVFKTITVDNGSEFADAEGLQRSIINEGEKRTKVYYCHPYSSWERGTNEVTNKMIRRKIPKGTNFDDRTEEEVESIENWINGYPRKIHGYHSAGELFEEEVKQLA